MNLTELDSFRELIDVSSSLDRIFGQASARTETDSGKPCFFRRFKQDGMSNTISPKHEKADAINASAP